MAASDDNHTNLPQNYVFLVGTVHRGPTIHKNPNGGTMAVLDLRTANPTTGKNSDFHNVVVFGGLATWCEHNLRPGMRVSVQGQLALRRWKQGAAWRSRPQVIVRQVFLAPMWSEWAGVEKTLADETAHIDYVPDPELGI